MINRTRTDGSRPLEEFHQVESLSRGRLQRRYRPLILAECQFHRRNWGITSAGIVDSSVPLFFFWQELQAVLPGFSAKKGLKDDANGPVPGPATKPFSNQGRGVRNPRGAWPPWQRTMERPDARRLEVGTSAAAPCGALLPAGIPIPRIAHHIIPKPERATFPRPSHPIPSLPRNPIPGTNTHTRARPGRSDG